MDLSEKQLHYYQYMDELLEALMASDVPNMPAINAALSKLCQLFNVSKGVTSFYESENNERLDKGEKFVCYDSGEESRIVDTLRVVSPAMTVTKCEVYQAIGAEPISEEDMRKIILIMKTIISVVSRNRLQQIVEKLSFYDSDGYRNFRFFTRQVHRFMDDDVLKEKTAVRFNLKHFALINQTITRAKGDIAMRNYFREFEKLIAESGTICRIGGDNFIMIFDKDLLHDIILILNGMDVIYDVNEGSKINISASAGVFEIPEDFEEASAAIMDRANSSLMAAKKSGNTDIVFFSDKMDEERKRLMEVEQALPEAMEKEEFKVYYQPKINVNNGELVGAEALCRWLHNGVLIPPNDFIPLMEQSLEICKLDFYMLDHVCKDIRRWLDEGKKAVRVSVNLSRKHMIDSELIEHIVAIVDRNRVPHKYIEIELTETTTDVEFRDLKRIVSGLQMLGFYTSVDDFGTGYSSLNLVKEIPWNVLKVDRSLLPDDVEKEDSISSIMFKYVVAMAKELGLECISEGVETNHQLKVLKDNHCDLAQGFYFDKPLPVDDFEDRMDIHKYEIN